MTQPDPTFGTPQVLQAGGSPKRGGGNLLLLYGEGEAAGLLKVYRRRGKARRETLKRLSFRLVERKRGVTAHERREIEARNLTLWRSHGFDVPRLLERPLPAEYASEPALWLEYCPGRTLFEEGRDPRIALPLRCSALSRAAADLGRRQQLALSMGERDLVMKYGSLKHILMFGERQVSFDLEGGYAPSMPLLDALADELSGFVRSLQRGASGTDLQALGQAFADGYAATSQLREIATYGASHQSLRGTFKRLDDRRRRGDGAKAAGLDWLLGLTR